MHDTNRKKCNKPVLIGYWCTILITYHFSTVLMYNKKLIFRHLLGREILLHIDIDPKVTRKYSLYDKYNFSFENPLFTVKCILLIFLCTEYYVLEEQS